MAIVAVSSSTVAGSTMTLPPHRPGDLIYLAIAATGGPVNPVGFGWRNQTSTGSAGLFIGSVWKEALTDNEGCGTFTNAYALSAVVYRSNINRGLHTDQWSSSTLAATAIYRMSPFATIRPSETAGAFLPLKRVHGVLVNSSSANLSANLPGGWVLQTEIVLASPTPTRFGIVDFDHTASFMATIDIGHSGGSVSTRTVGTGIAETPYAAVAGRGFNPGFSGNGIGVF